MQGRKDLIQLLLEHGTYAFVGRRMSLDDFMLKPQVTLSEDTLK
jgi:hypothetical protein